ncbi:MAG TPA: Lrp/AsnC family transcriptional regulator [Gemmatimonadaceae bacterium]
MELDRTDFDLVAAVQENAAQRLEDLAKRVSLAPSSVHERLRRLERAGVIRRWTIECDASALGLPILAFIGVHSTRRCSELRPALEAIPEIEECHSVAGSASMLLKVRAESTPALLALTERLRQIPGVVSTETTVVLETQFDRPLRHPGSAPPAARKARRG